MNPRATRIVNAFCIVCLVIALLIGAAWLLGSLFPFTYSFGPRHQVHWALFVDSENVAVGRHIVFFDDPNLPGPPNSWTRVHWASWDWFEMFRYSVVVPCASALLRLRDWWRAVRVRRSRGCAKCGYDLTGNVSGICPECGTPCPFSAASGRHVIFRPYGAEFEK